MHHIFFVSSSLSVQKGKGSLNSSPSTSSLKTPDSDPGARESNSKEDTEEPTKSQQVCM